MEDSDATDVQGEHRSRLNRASARRAQEPSLIGLTLIGQDAKGKGVAVNSSPQRDRRHQAQRREGGTATEDPIVADLIAMVMQIRLENRRLEDQLAKLKLEIENLQDDLRSLRRGLSAKLKRLYRATGQEELYFD